MRLLALVESSDHVCCRYRLAAFEPALREAGWVVTREPLARGTLARARQLRSASRYDAVFLQRRLLPAWQFAILRRSARRLAFDFDDAVYLRDSYDRRGAVSRRRGGRFAVTVRGADVVLAGNDFLADAALRAGAGPERVRTIPTCVDPADYPVKEASRRDGPPELVWIGSSGTLKGVEARRPLWERLGREIPGLRLRVICDRFPDFKGIEIVPVPWSRASEATELVAGDVGIGMIPDDDWSRGKCGLKILQYQAAGLPTIANPAGSHVEMIQPGATGFLPADDDAWVAAARACFDAGLRARMGALARRRLEGDYSTAAWARAFAAAVAGADEPRPGAIRGPMFTREKPRSTGVGGPSRRPTAESPRGRRESQ